MNNRQFLAVLSLCVCATSVLAAPGLLVVKERAAEVSGLTLSGSSNQLLYVRECDQCEPVTVSVNAQTRFYDAKTPVTASDAARLRDRDATVFFDEQTRKVSRIVFWQ